VKAKLEEENDEDSLKFLSKAVDTVRKQVGHINFCCRILQQKRGKKLLSMECVLLHVCSLMDIILV
jgi:hypothetical protein